MLITSQNALWRHILNKALTTYQLLNLSLFVYPFFFSYYNASSPTKQPPLSLFHTPVSWNQLLANQPTLQSPSRTPRFLSLSVLLYFQVLQPVHFRWTRKKISHYSEDKRPPSVWSSLLILPFRNYFGKLLSRIFC